MIIFPMSELYFLHEDANDFGVIIIFSLLQLRYMLYPQTFLQCDPQCLEDVRIESIKFLDTEKNLNRIFSIEEIQLHFNTNNANYLSLASKFQTPPSRDSAMCCI